MPLMNFYAIALSPSLPQAQWPRENTRESVCVCVLLWFFFFFAAIIYYFFVYIFFIELTTHVLRRQSCARSLFSAFGAKATIRISALCIVFAFSPLCPCCCLFIFIHIGWDPYFFQFFTASLVVAMRNGNLRLWASWGVMNGATSRTRAELPMPIKDTDTESVGTCLMSTSPNFL